MARCGLLALVLLFAPLQLAAAQEPADPAPAQDPAAQQPAAAPAGDATGDADADERAVRTAIDSYVKAFNQHDAAAVAGHWTAGGEFVTPGGQVVTGREALVKEFTAYFEEAKDARLEIGRPAIEFLSPGVAVERGAALVVRPDRPPLETDYEAVHVKTADGWKMDSVREQQYVAPQSHYRQLQALEWMIGEWVDADDEAVVETNCRWTKNQNFITRSFRVYVEDRIDLEGTQVIGWDPSVGKIRSWVFDSEGGFGVGVWSQRGRRWTVQALRVLPDGSRGSVTTVMQQEDQDSFTFHTVGRQAGGRLLPNIGPVKVVRK